MLRVVLASTGVALLSSFGGADIRARWRTVDVGGGVSSGGTYGLKGTAGQPDAGPAHNGGGYSLVGGFWRGARNLYISGIFADGFETGNTTAWSLTQGLAPFATGRRAAPGLEPADRPGPAATSGR